MSDVKHSRVHSGKLYEKLAVQLLISDGWVVTDSPYKAADLIAEKGEQRLLINVKSGRSQFNIEKTNLSRLLLIGRQEKLTPAMLFISGKTFHLYVLLNNPLE
jgi:Holliday junction resolvase-like predicted endonuclease